MKLVGLMPVRNEDWVLALSARVALQWCDALVMYMHACDDNSGEIAADLEKQEGHERVRIIWNPCNVWEEMVHREYMLFCARQEGATHIAMIDADEVLTANMLRGLDTGHCCIKGIVEQLAPGEMLELPGYNLRGSLDRYHANGIWGNRWFSLAFKDTPEAHWGGDKFHSRNPAGVRWRSVRPINQGEGGVLHLWGASERRLRAKHALYKVTERLRWPAKPALEIDRMYNLWRSEQDQWTSYPRMWPDNWAYAEVPPLWWDFSNYENFDLNADATPWQEAEVRRLIEEHGRDRFYGLDLFGIA